MYNLRELFLGEPLLQQINFFWNSHPKWSMLRWQPGQNIRGSWQAACRRGVQMPYESMAAVTERQVHEQAVCQQGSGLRKIAA